MNDGSWVLSSILGIILSLLHWSGSVGGRTVLMGPAQ